MFHSSTALRSVPHQNIPHSLLNRHHPNNTNTISNSTSSTNTNTSTAQPFPDLKLGAAARSYTSGPSHQKASNNPAIIIEHHSRPQQSLSAAAPAQTIGVKKVRRTTETNRPAAGAALSTAADALTLTLTLTAVVTVRRKRHPSPNEVALDRIDAIADSAGQKVFLQLVSADVDKHTGVGKRSSKAALQDWSQKVDIVADKIQYIARFTINSNFGTPAAITIENNHQNELFIETIALTGVRPNSAGTIFFPCYSWIQPKYKTNSRERVFFSNEALLPSQTPAGLKDLREQDKASKRGNGKGTRKEWDTIYDYDVYNDVGNPDKDIGLTRPILGGSAEYPYPRRCRTGRRSTKTLANAEQPLDAGTNYYVPRDEAFHEVKQESFIMNVLKGAVHQMVPLVTSSLKEDCDDFHCFHAIDQLYQEGIKLRNFQTEENGIIKGLPMSSTIKNIENSANQVSEVLQFAEPSILSRDRFAWMRDDEFGRQMLAGANPVNIQRLSEFPPKSTLDPEVYGPSTSAITKEHFTGRLEGLSVEEAMEKGKLFILDYHDAYMPFVNKVNALEGRKLYATRTILFHTKAGSMLPLAIELSLPPASKGNTNGSQRVFTPGQDSTSHWKWQLAKAHVSSNDAGFHQLVNHWLRSHASVEPYVIASHRQLSRMHPVFKLLEPHFRYTLEINASARQLLINADGVIENCFTSGPFSLDISAYAYSSQWRFDHESLPADLLNRGMAIKDENQPNGLKLVLEDYPYAADGLLIWNAIEMWVDEYISLYYDNPESIVADVEIQSWWDEIKNKGHPDKKDEAWWPNLNTPEDLKGILTTIIWIVSGFHAALNFGQYAYAGYVPNRPSMTRRLVPKEGTPEYDEFSSNPEAFFLSTIPNQLQATTLMTVVDSLSSHSPDEEYLGQRVASKWTKDPRVIEAFERFSMSMEVVEQAIKLRNEDPSLKNRNGAGVMPYELLMPTSGPGKTGRGVPNSISI